MSSLSIGSRERIGNSGNDTFYLPSCNLLVRRSAFREAGGFFGNWQGVEGHTFGEALACNKELLQHFLSIMSKKKKPRQ